MKKLTMLFVCLAFLGIHIVNAQTRTITGTVTSSEDGSKLPGVNVIIKGTTQGTITNVDGFYSLTVSADVKSLVFSFVGMQTKEVEIGASNTVDVILEPEVVGVEEIVVTALGLQANKDRLGGAVTRISNESIKNTGESGLIQSMSGKTSGVLIVKNTGDPGAGAYIQIRGQNTITSSLQPLIVIDGVPMINSSRNSSTETGNDDALSDVVVQQSRLNDLNPNDIQSIDVLKGASAAAVWGTRAANGVIIITTKSGSGKGKNISVDINTGFSWDQVSIEHKKQDIWGQGTGGSWVANTGGSWGDKIAERAGGADEVNTGGAYFKADNGHMYYPIITKNSKATYNDVNRDQVFRTGKSTDLSASVSLNSDKSSTFISLSDWSQQGVIAGNSDYDRSTVRVNYTNNPSSKLKFKLNTFYAHIASDRIQQGSNLNGLYLGYLRTSPDFDNTDYKGTYYNASGVPTYNSQRGYRRYMGDRPPAYNNPGWTIHEQKNTSTVERLMINPEVNYDLLQGSKLSSKLTARFGYDQSTDDRITFFPVNSASNFALGSFQEEWLIEKEKTFEVFARTAHTFNNMNFSWIIGGQFNARDYNYHGATMSNFINQLDQIYTYSNATAANTTTVRNESHRRSLAEYLVMNFDMYDQVFVEFTGRSEKSNAFKDFIFYPSASVAWQFSKMIPANNLFSFGKLRASYGTIGIEPDLYITNTDFVSAKMVSGWGETMDASQYDGGLQRSTIQGNPDIKPEKKTEFEIGTDLRFFSDRLTTNLTYYSNKTTDAIFQVVVPASTGYNSKWENAAVLTNKGVELDINGTIVNNKDFSWNILVNYSKNKNNVEDLKGVKRIFLNGFTGTSSYAVEGKPLGALMGGVYMRDANGEYVLDGNGFPQQAIEEGVIGDPNPDWKGGLGTTLNYKNFAFNILFETSQGGDMWAGSEAVLRNFGIAPETANEVTLNEDVVNYWGDAYTSGETVRGNIHNFGGGNVLLDEGWYTGLGGGFGAVSEDFIHDASFIRLREVSLTYNFSKDLLSKFKIGNLSVSLIGRNLALWSVFADKYGVDPETNLTGVSNGRGLDYFTNPSTKSYLVKFSIGF
jgi:TonB-linked SusC/RagA family outer membrane protein